MTQKPSPLSTIEELLGAHELCRRFGFLSDDIYVNYDRSLRKVGIILEGENGIQQGFGIANYGAHEEELREMWDVAVARWNGDDMSEEERERIYTGSVSFRNWHVLLTRMQEIDFSPKGGWNPSMDILGKAISGRVNQATH
jgi:hypothetical protein